MSKTDKLLKSLSHYIDWRYGNRDDMPDIKEVSLMLKECYNIISFFDMELRHSKGAANTISNLKDLLK